MHVIRHLVELHLPHRKDPQSFIAHHADIQFPPFDELFDERLRADALMNEADPLLQLLVIVNDGSL
jgi:hypothetical protein